MLEVIDSDTFTWFGRDRRKQRLISGEGGVGILVRNRIGRTTVAKVSNDFDIIWIQINIGIETLYIAAVYMSPIGTTRETDAANFRLELEDDIVHFRALGKVVVMGDLNSRIGNTPSVVLKSGRLRSFNRITKDNKVTRQGKDLIESLNANSMIILNGIDGGGENTFISRHSGEPRSTISS